MQEPGPEQQRRSLGLYRDCSRCVGLCCVALTFRASDGFPYDKRADSACDNLLTDNNCNVHAELADREYHGCISYDCFGAGQRISGDRAPDLDWRRSPLRARSMFQALPAWGELHEWLWYLTEVLDRLPPGPVRARAEGLMDAAVALTRTPTDELSWGDVHRLGQDVLPVLDDASRQLRAGRGDDLPGAELRAADLRGADLRGADLRGADLRAAVLDGADLTGADLTEADLRGATLRRVVLTRADLTRADLRWTDQLWAVHRQAGLFATVLTGALFLTRGQLDASHGTPIIDEAPDPFSAG